MSTTGRGILRLNMADRSRWMSMSLRSGWSMERILGQPRLLRENLSWENNNKKEKKKGGKKVGGV